MSIHAHSAHAHHHRHSFRSRREVPTANMAPSRRLVVRDNSHDSTALTPTMVNLLIALLILVIFGILLIAGLMILRSRRTREQRLAQEQAEKTAGSNPEFSYNTSPRSSHKSNHRRLTVTAAPYGRNSKPIFSYSEKEVLMGDSPPTSPIPEIRITFPEEEDEMGKRKSGRVVVVSVSDRGSVGLEPLRDERESLPAYEGPGWKELDLEQLGGLKEIERRS